MKINQPSSIFKGYENNMEAIGFSFYYDYDFFMIMNKLEGAFTS